MTDRPTGEGLYLVRGESGNEAHCFTCVVTIGVYFLGIFDSLVSIIESIVPGVK